MVKTQGCIHVIHVLQESKEILHLLKCDTLHKIGNVTNHRVSKELVILQFYYNPVKNQSISQILIKAAQRHTECSSAV